MNPITILLAEDSFGDQKLFEMALKDYTDVHLEIIPDGKEAFEFLQREGKYEKARSPNLVVLDLNLPKMNGSEILERMEKDSTLKRLPVVIFSGAKPTERLLFNCKHASLYIVKPDGVDTYFVVVKSLVEYCRNILKFPDSAKKSTNELQLSLTKSQHCNVYIPDVAAPSLLRTVNE